MFIDQTYLPLLQLGLLPLLAAMLWRLRIQGQRVPRALILGAAALAVSAFAVGYSAKTLTEKRIIISRFSDDPLGSDSRIFRERLDEQLKGLSSLRVVRFPGSFNTYAEIRKKYAHGRNFDAFLWGKKDSFVLIFPKPEIKLSKSFYNLKISSEIPPMSLSRSGDTGTVEFVADLIAAVLGDQNNSGHREILLQSALGVQSRWRSRSHKALAAWLLGNDALQASIDGEFEPAELQCALKHFAGSSSAFNGKRDPQLAAAVYNSWGVALAIDGWMRGDKEALAQAESQFKRAVETRKFAGTAGVAAKTWQMARDNLQLLRGKTRAHKHRTGKIKASTKRRAD